jgi:hypothetical protein
MTCPACAKAAAELHHEFRQGCAGCCARMAARTPHYRRVRDAGVQDREYRRLLEQFQLTHQQVKEAAVLDAMHGEGA